MQWHGSIEEVGFYQLNSTRSDSTNQPSNSTTELRFAPIKYPSNVHLVYIWVADFGHLELCDRCESQHCFENWDLYLKTPLTYTEPTKYPEVLSYLYTNPVSLIGIISRLRAGYYIGRGYLCSLGGPPPNRTTTSSFVVGPPRAWATYLQA